MSNELEELEAEVLRIRAKRAKHFDGTKLRKILNFLFLIAAFAGVATYYAMPENHHQMGFIVMGIAIALKLAELFVRFVF